MALTFASGVLLPATSMGASITSDPINLSTKDAFAVHAIYTGSPVGTISLEASIDGVSYSTIAGSSTTISGASDVFLNVKEANYMWARLVYSFTSGSGSLTAHYSTREDSR